MAPIRKATISSPPTKKTPTTSKADQYGKLFSGVWVFGVEEISRPGPSGGVIGTFSRRCGDGSGDDDIRRSFNSQRVPVRPARLRSLSYWTLGAALSLIFVRCR